MKTEIQQIDRIRAAQMVAAQVTGDREMFAVSLQDAVDDERDISIVNIIRVLSEDLAGIIVDAHGDNAVTFVRHALASQMLATDESRHEND